MSGLLDRLRDWVAPFEGAARDGPPGGDPPQPPSTPERTNRRVLAPTPAERQFAEAIAQKLLHGWLQNRHQTLMPLSVSLARLADADRAHVVRFAAVAATASTDAGAPARLADWLASAGADPAALAAYEAALASPPALAKAMADMDVPDRAAVAYVLALVAARGSGAGHAAQAFAAYVASRLALPSAALRSAERRYGR